MKMFKNVLCNKTCSGLSFAILPHSSVENRCFIENSPKTSFFVVVLSKNIKINVHYLKFRYRVKVLLHPQETRGWCHLFVHNR